LAWAKGFTRDGWEYRVYFSENDGRFRVEFTDWRKEIWLLEDLTVPTVEKEYIESLASQIAYRLEREGAIVIRGTKREIPKKETVTPWGRAKLVLDRAVPSAGVVAEVLRERREEEIVPGAPPVPTPAPPTPTPPTIPPAFPKEKKRVGLGLRNEDLRRLRELFESTVRATMGIAPTKNMKILAEEVIHHLDRKYKSTPRDEAFEKATMELLRWIRDEFYYSTEI